MTQTFDLFLYETYPDVGYPADDYRLVQAWAWYSLSDQHYNGYLFYNDSQQISPMGQAYADYTAALTDTQADYTDLATQLWVNLDPLEHLTPTVPYDALTVTLPVTGAVANLGKVEATGVVITSPLLGFQATQDVSGRYEEDITPLPFPMLVFTQPGGVAHRRPGPGAGRPTTLEQLLHGHRGRPARPAGFGDGLDHTATGHLERRAGRNSDGGQRGIVAVTARFGHALPERHAGHPVSARSESPHSGPRLWCSGDHRGGIGSAHFERRFLLPGAGGG
jgi:hypothetical protein